MELAVCLPVIVLIVFASIEACSMMFLKQSLYSAAYEGARVAIRPKATSAAVDQRIAEVLSARQISDSTTTLEPGDVAGAVRGTDVTVTVAAPCSANMVMRSWFFGGKQLVARCTMVKE